MKRELQGVALLLLCWLALLGIVHLVQLALPLPDSLFAGGAVGLLLSSGRLLNWLRSS